MVDRLTRPDSCYRLEQVNYIHIFVSKKKKKKKMLGQEAGRFFPSGIPPRTRPPRSGLQGRRYGGSQTRHRDGLVPGLTPHVFSVKLEQFIYELAQLNEDTGEIKEAHMDIVTDMPQLRAMLDVRCYPQPSRAAGDRLGPTKSRSTRDTSPIPTGDGVRPRRSRGRSRRRRGRRRRRRRTRRRRRQKRRSR